MTALRVSITEHTHEPPQRSKTGEPICVEQTLGLLFAPEWLREIGIFLVKTEI